MLFIDFEKLKIIKDFHFTTIEKELNLENLTILEMKDETEEFFKDFIKVDPLAVSYVIDIKTSEPTPEFFVSMINIINSIFFNKMITEKGWKREYRLDVPEKLKGLHCNMSLIKKACNTKTINNVFNLTIKCGEFIYYLCDEKDFKDNPEFVHDVEELETKDE